MNREMLKVNRGVNLKKLGERDKKGTKRKRGKLSKIYLSLTKKR